MKTQIFNRAIVSAGIVALLAMLLPSAAWAQDKSYSQIWCMARNQAATWSGF